MLMPFGRFKGVDIQDLPSDYLSWLVENIELRQPLLEAVDHEVKARKRATDDQSHHSARERRKILPSTSLRLSSDQVNLVREIVEAGYRAVARRCHPDAGGDAHEMVRLNLIAESLRAQLTELEGRG
jgi:hypothetical protein